MIKRTFEVREVLAGGLSSRRLPARRWYCALRFALACGYGSIDSSSGPSAPLGSHMRINSFLLAGAKMV
jgi:hypothetical protein